MDDEGIAASAGFATLGYVAVSYGLGRFLRLLLDGETRIRGYGTSIYWTGIDAVDTLVLVGFGLGFGYVVGREIEFDRVYRRFLTAVGSGSTIAIALVWAVLVLADRTWGRFDDPAAFFVTSLFDTVVQVALVMTVCAVAGAALANARATAQRRG